MGITHKKDLRDGDAVWASYAVPKILGSRLHRSTRADVAALLGSTAASTSLLQFELDTPLIKLSRSIGRRKAEKVWLASRDAVNELEKRMITGYVPGFANSCRLVVIGLLHGWLVANGGQRRR
jgi:hypothetical protein